MATPKGKADVAAIRGESFKRDGLTPYSLDRGEVWVFERIEFPAVLDMAGRTE